MHSVRRATSLLVMALCTTAHATERARVVLSYERGETAVKACPDEGTFRALVAARLGYDPVAKEAPLALRVEFRPRGSGVTGSLELTSEGAAKGRRSMDAAPGDCYELAASLALAVAVAVDPEGARAQSTATEPASAAPSDPQPVAAPQPISTPPPSTPPPSNATPPPPPSENGLGISADAGALVSVGLQPGPAPGLRFGASLHHGPWSVGLEAAAFLPSEREQPYGTVSAHALYGSLVPCVHPGSRGFTVDLCAVVSVGALFSNAEGVAQPRPVTDRYTTVGPRVGITLRASEAVGVAVSAEAPVPLPRVHLIIDDAGERHEAWASSSVGFIGGATVVLKLR